MISRDDCEVIAIVPMLLRRALVAPGSSMAKAGISFLRISNDGIDEAAVGCDAGAGDAVAELFDLLLPDFLPL
jgi:hypothetical protein